METVKTDIEALRRLAGLDSYKASDKAELVPLLEKYGIEKPAKTSCKSCWRDAAIMALREAKKGVETDEGLPRLRGNAAINGVWHRGRFVSNETMTREMAKWMEAHGFPKQLLER